MLLRLAPAALLLATLVPPASGDVEIYYTFAAYDAAVSGSHDLFVDFETDSGGNAVVPSEDADGDTRNDIHGGTFSNAVTYSSPDHVGFPERVNIATIQAPYLNEVGPMGTWDGILRWDYSTLYRATAFTGVDMEASSVIRFYQGDVLVDQTMVGGSGETFVFVGFVTTNPFDRVELDGLFYAIDGHYSSLAPECFLVLGHAAGSASFNASGYTWNTQLADIFAYFPVLLDDIPSFPLPDRVVPWVRDPNARDWQPVVVDRMFVQVLMNNPEVFPNNPEQYTHGLEVTLWSNGRVTALSFGSADGMGIELETGVGPSGQRYFRFPFTIAGLGG